MGSVGWDVGIGCYGESFRSAQKIFIVELNINGDVTVKSPSRLCEFQQLQG